MKVLNRVFMAIIGALCGFAAGVRMVSAVMQVFGADMGVLPAAAAALLTGAVFGIFAPVIYESAKKHIPKKRAVNIILLAVSVLVCFKFQYLFLDFQIKTAVSFTERILALAGTAVIVWIFLMYFLHAVTVVFSWSKIKSKLNGINRYDVFFALGVFLVLNILMLLFCLNNKTICFWDNAGFWLTAKDMAKVYSSQGAAAVVRSVYGSVFTTDYNYIIALPQTALVLLFGEARIVYIMGITNFYMYPLLMLIYAFAGSFVKRPVLSAACTVLSFPMIFYITKEGYIDVGAIVFAMLSVVLWARKLCDKSVERYIIIGLLLVLSMLLRRWLVFFVISYIIALTADCIVYKKSAVPLAAVIASLAFVLVSVFQPYVTLKLMANYKDMYSAYDQGIMQDFLNVSHYFGIIPLLLAFAGAGVLLISKKTRQTVLLMLMQLVCCFFVFVQIQTHGEQHLLLYIPSLSCLLCLTYDKLWSVRGKAVIGSAALSGAVAVSSIAGVTVNTDNIDSQKFTLTPRFSCMPAVRYDADEVIELIRWLDVNAGDKGKSAAVLASSMVFNREILCNAEGSLNIPRISSADRDEYLLWLPQVDSRDGAPYAVPDADYVVLAEPIQLHLGEQNQQCVVIPAESFINRTDIANAYMKLDKEYALGWDGSVRVSIYERVRHVSEEERAEYTKKLREAGLE